MIRWLAALLLVTAGCTAQEEAPPRPAAEPAPFADCAALSAPPSPAPADLPGAAGRPLPDLTLSCFTGGAEVRVGELRGPAVVNLWASWCGPCRQELPAFQRLAEHTAGRLQVVGVNTRDDRPRAVSVGEDLGLTFPNVIDTDQRLQRELAPNVLPITIFVDAQGRIRHQDVSGALDDARLADLLRQHLGVEVPA